MKKNSTVTRSFGTCILGDGHQTNLKTKLSARSTDSFRQTLELLIKFFDCKNCFEWGAGNSTEIFCKLGCSIVSVESDEYYLHLVERKFHVDGAHFVVEPDKRYYPYVRGDHSPYDLIFIDGRMREECLRQAKNIIKKDGLVILHDAERPDYSEGKNNYKYQFYTDNGNTVTLVDNDETASKVKEILSTNSF